MNLRLISNPPPAKDRRLIRTMQDVVWLQQLTIPEVRARYEEIEAMRDALSQLLDRADGKR